MAIVPKSIFSSLNPDVEGHVLQFTDLGSLFSLKRVSTYARQFIALFDDTIFQARFRQEHPYFEKYKNPFAILTLDQPYSRLCSIFSKPITAVFTSVTFSPSFIKELLASRIEKLKGAEGFEETRQTCEKLLKAKQKKSGFVKFCQLFKRSKSNFDEKAETEGFLSNLSKLIHHAKLVEYFQTRISKLAMCKELIHKINANQLVPSEQDYMAIVNGITSDTDDNSDMRRYLLVVAHAKNPSTEWRHHLPQLEDWVDLRIAHYKQWLKGVENTLHLSGTQDYIEKDLKGQQWDKKG
jgi:hypothetical protein